MDAGTTFRRGARKGGVKKKTPLGIGMKFCNFMNFICSRLLVAFGNQSTNHVAIFDHNRVNLRLGQAMCDLHADAPRDLIKLWITGAFEHLIARNRNSNCPEDSVLWYSSVIPQGSDENFVERAGLDSFRGYGELVLKRFLVERTRLIYMAESSRHMPDLYAGLAISLFS